MQVTNAFHSDGRFPRRQRVIVCRALYFADSEIFTSIVGFIVTTRVLAILDSPIDVSRAIAACGHDDDALQVLAWHT